MFDGPDNSAENTDTAPPPLDLSSLGGGSEDLGSVGTPSRKPTKNDTTPGSDKTKPGAEGETEIVIPAGSPFNNDPLDRYYGNGQGKREAAASKRPGDVGYQTNTPVDAPGQKPAEVQIPKTYTSSKEAVDMAAKTGLPLFAFIEQPDRGGQKEANFDALAEQYNGRGVFLKLNPSDRNSPYYRDIRDGVLNRSGGLREIRVDKDDKELHVKKYSGSDDKDSMARWIEGAAAKEKVKVIADTPQPPRPVDVPQPVNPNDVPTPIKPNDGPQPNKPDEKAKKEVYWVGRERDRNGQPPRGRNDAPVHNDFMEAVNYAADHNATVEADFGTEWCGYCPRASAQLLREAKQHAGDKDKVFLHIDVDFAPTDSASKQIYDQMSRGVNSYPTVRTFSLRRGENGSIVVERQ